MSSTILLTLLFHAITLSAATVTGHVYYKDDPQPGAVVELRSAEQSRTVVVDVDGAFTITNVECAKHLIRATLESLVQDQETIEAAANGASIALQLQPVGGCPDFTVVAAPDGSTIDATPRSSLYSGRVIDDDGSPVGPVLVEALEGSSPLAPLLTEKDGRFCLELDEPVSTLQFSATGHRIRKIAAPCKREPESEGIVIRLRRE